MWDHWKTKRPHHWEHTCEQISETHHHWGVWVAAVGRKQPLQRELYERRWRLRRRRLVLSNTLWELLYSGVCGCGIIGDMHGEQKPEQSNHLEVGVAMVGVKQHTFETTALGCVWGGARMVASNTDVLLLSSVSCLPGDTKGGVGATRFVVCNTDVLLLLPLGVAGAESCFRQTHQDENELMPRIWHKGGTPPHRHRVGGSSQASHLLRNPALDDSIGGS